MPSVASVIAGATKVSQIESNVVAGQWQPTPEDLQTLVDLTALTGVWSAIHTGCGFCAKSWEG